MSELAIYHYSGIPKKCLCGPISEVRRSNHHGIPVQKKRKGHGASIKHPVGSTCIPKSGDQNTSVPSRDPSPVLQWIPSKKYKSILQTQQMSISCFLLAIFRMRHHRWVLDLKCKSADLCTILRKRDPSTKYS